MKSSAGTSTFALALGWMLWSSAALRGAAPASSALDRAATFHRDVLPILQRACQACHRQGGDNYTGMVAPMALTTYDEVRPWAKAIAKNVETRVMPPWYADPRYHGVFKNERTLSEHEIETIVGWVKAGAPAGDPAAAPRAREFPELDGWRIGAPDLVVDAPRYFVPDDVDTHYQSHVVELTPDILAESRFISAIEWRGGSSVVHHIVGYAYLPGADVKDRSKAYGLGSIAPGEEPMAFPEGFAKILVAGSKLVFSTHYHKEKGPGTGVWDRSQVAFRFHPAGTRVDHFVEHNGISNGAFDIPPGAANWRVGAARHFAEDSLVLALHPHMHLRGKNARYVARYPDGTSEELLSVPGWNFNWQTDYSFAQPKVLPAGTLVDYSAHFDNSTANAANPDPRVAIDNGPETTDEMMIGYITWARRAPRALTVEDVLRDYLHAEGRSDETD